MLDENHPYHNTGPFPLSFFFSAVENVEAVNDTTVRFTLNEPYAPFLSNLAYPTGLIVSPSAVETHGTDFGRNPSGTGAFKFAEWRSNEAVVVEANSEHWDGARNSKLLFSGQLQMPIQGLQKCSLVVLTLWLKCRLSLW